MSVNAKFIGGPWHGRLVEIRELLPFYEVALMDDMYPGGWYLSATIEPIEVRTVRYQLYDNCPVKYLAEDDWGDAPP